MAAVRVGSVYLTTAKAAISEKSWNEGWYPEALPLAGVNQRLAPYELLVVIVSPCRMVGWWGKVVVGGMVVVPACCEPR